MGRRWNQALNYYENKEKYNSEKMKKRPDWIKESRPTETKEINEFLFSKILLDLRKPKYEKIETLDADRYDEEVKKGTTGASDLREKNKFGPWVSPLVYQRTKKVKAKGSTPAREFVVQELRIVDAFQRDNNYQTFILRELWEYDRDDGQTLMTKYESKLKKAKLWDKYGWSKEPPPQRPSKRQRYDLEGYIELLQKEEEEAEQKWSDALDGKIAK